MLIYQESYFNRTAERAPHLIAVDDHGTRITYGDLDVQSNQLAHVLIDVGCEPNDRICVFMEKTTRQYASVLAALKAGGCWVPLSAAFPHERLKDLVQSLRPKAIVCDVSNFDKAKLAREEAGVDCTLIVLDGEDERGPGILGVPTVQTASTGRPVVLNRSPEDLAYIIFTSGSTGTPKGVMVKHRNTVQFLELCAEFFNIEEGLRFAHFSDLTFDPSVFDMFHCWACGGTLVPFNRRRYRINPGLFFKELNINVLFTVPSVIVSIQDGGMLNSADLSSIRYLLLTGEPLPPKLVRAWYDAHPDSSVFNMFGTTETAIVSHWYEIPKDINPDTPIPVGKPLPGTRVLLMENDRLVPSGCVGESIVSGSQLSAGYWANEFQTRQTFTKNPLDDNLPVTVYRTGDILMKGEDGLYYFVGRVDNQIKLRGQRIELGEVENVIRQHKSVLDAAVIAVSGDGSGKYDRLAAFVTLVPKETTDGIETFIAKRLPRYMAPWRVVFLPNDMPRNSNGKIDRQELLKRAKKMIAS